MLIFRELIKMNFNCKAIFRSVLGRPVEHGVAKPRILLVCTANICRSPMAEGALRRTLTSNGIEAVLDSAATHDTHLGMPPHPMAVVTAKRRGIDITRLRARAIEPRDFGTFDLILAMDRANRTHLLSIAPRGCRGKVRLLLDFNRCSHGSEVADPYGCGWRQFDRALDSIQLGCRGVAKALMETPRSSVLARGLIEPAFG